MKPICFFIRKITRYRSKWMAGMLLSLLLAASSIALLTLSGWFISAAAFAGLLSSTAIAFNYFIPAGLIRFLALTRILSRYFDRVINHDYTFKILRDLRVWFYEKLIPLSPSKLLSARSGDLLNRMVNDIDTLDHAYLNVLSPLITSTLLVISTLIFTAFFSFSLMLILLIGFGLSLFLLLMITIKKSNVIGESIQKTTAILRTKIIDAIQGLADLLLYFSQEKRFLAIESAQNDFIAAQQKLSRLKGFIQSAMVFASQITLFFILWFGIQSVHNHALNGALFAMIVFLTLAVFEQLSALPLSFLFLGKSSAAANRLLQITQQKPDVIFPEKPIDTQSNAITIEKITFMYPDRIHPVLSDFSLSIAENEKIGITGDSGVGKSTLLHLIARIVDPTQGAILIGKNNLKSFPENQLKQKIALVPQQVHIFNASVRDNITLMNNNISDEMIFSVLEKIDLADYIFNLPEKLNTEMGEFGKRFSGGQIRRIAIARALLVNPDILLLDEPSTGLEEKLMEKIWMRCETDFQHKTIIVATHDERFLLQSGIRISRIG